MIEVGESLNMNLLGLALLPVSLGATILSPFNSNAGIDRVNLRMGQDSAKEVFQKASPSIYVIIALDSHDQPQALGSGFAVSPNLIATNYHVIHNSFKLKILSATTKESLSVAGIKGIDGDKDLALIQVDSTLLPLELKTSNVDVGETIYAIGNPRGLEASLSSGLVSASRESDGREEYQISAPISPGSSGGPVLTSDEKVIGVATSYLEGSQNLNFAVKSIYLKNLIDASGSVLLTDVGKCSGAPLRDSLKPSVQSVKINSPDWQGAGDQYDLTISDFKSWKFVVNLSVENDGDKPVTGVDLQIVFFDNEGKEMIDAERQWVTVRAEPGLAKRTSFEIKGLDFNTYPATRWKASFRVLSYTTEDQ